MTLAAPDLGVWPRSEQGAVQGLDITPLRQWLASLLPGDREIEIAP